ncbi:MAG: response regulator, partial [Gammaproteobacteria bacterium]|nr:response regulator [Gammaproteobacteria bacterium]
AEKLFGYTCEEAIGQQLDLLLPESIRIHHAEYLTKFSKSGDIARKMGERGEITGRRKDGSLFPMEASICAIGEGEDLVFTAIARDVSERHAQNKALEEAKEAAESADYAKSMFLANMSHEIRTPLNAVVGMTSLLLDTRLSDEQKDCTETIRSSSEALLSIINDILDYSKIEVGKLELEYHPFDLRVCIEESLDLVSSIAAEKQLNLAYMIDDGVPAVIVSDITRLRQILVNLLSNATKFTHRGEVVVSVKARQTGSSEYRFQFSVADTGIGIPEDRIEELFSSFNQLDASTTRKFGGSGLGLAISRRLVEIMGDKMWVESEPGHGSTFHFNLIAEAGGEDLAHSFLQDDAIELTAKRILIVDDNMTNRRILVKQSLLWGMVPTATASGVEAMDLIRHGHAFDVAILDMSMPEMDGLDLAQRIRKYRAAESLPLVMLTSLSQRPDAEIMKSIHFDAFLSKPIKASQLFNVLKLALRVDTEKDIQQPVSGFDVTLADKNPLRILIVEDNAINQKVVQQILMKFGYRSDNASNGLEALNALERQHYDLILMDIHMPVMDGLQAAEKIQQRIPSEQRPRIVAMTANVLPEDRRACERAGMLDFLAKPIDLDQLQKILGNTSPGREDDQNADSHLELQEIDYDRIDMIRAAQGEDEPDLLASIIDMFIADANDRLLTMHAACDNSDWSLLEEDAHRFYSSASNLGLLRISDICTELELKSADTSVNKKALLERLSEALTRILPELEKQKLTL